MNDHDFQAFSSLFEGLCGIHLTPVKKAMLSGRLIRRIRECGLDSYASYYQLISKAGNTAERQLAIDLVTTNETYFFRESKHFDALRERFLPAYKGKALRAWSAACSSGEEAYSLAMTLAHTLGLETQWQVLGSDISSRMLDTARRALYSMEKAREVPADYLRRYCLRGTGEYQGMLLVERSLRQKVQFQQLNLIESLHIAHEFDLIFLRNVIIYFDAATKRRVVEAISEQLRPGGWLVVGHSESLLHLPPTLKPLLPTIYHKVMP